VLDVGELPALQGPSQGPRRRYGLRKCKEACLKGAMTTIAKTRFVTEEVRRPSWWPPDFRSTTSAASRAPASRATAEYGYGEVPDVIDGLQFERIASASGPTSGEMLRPSDGHRAQDRRLRQVRRLARPRKGHRLLLQDLLHVHGQAHHALQAQGARRPRGGLLHGHPRGARGTTSSRGGPSKKTARVHPRNASAASSATATR